MVLRYSPGFYPFSDPSPGTHPGPSLVLAQISIFLILARIPPFQILARTFLGYSPEFRISLVLAHISTFRHSPGPFSDTSSDPILSRYSPEPFSGTRPDFYFSGTRPDFYLSGTRPDFFFFFLALTRILPFPGTRPNFSMVLARIPPFSGTRPDFHISGTRPDPTFSSTCLDFYFSGPCPDSTLSRYSPGSFSGTRINQSLMFRIIRFLFGFDPFCIEFSNTHPDRFPFCFGDSPSSHSNPLVLMFKNSGIVSRFSYTTSSIVTGSFSFRYCV